MNNKPSKTHGALKHRWLSLVSLSALAFFPGELVAQTWLINFNTSTGYRGASQTNADSNGNLWNNVNPSFWSTLTNAAGTASGGFRGNLLGSGAGLDS